MQQQHAVLAIYTLCGLGILCILGYLLGGRTRSYLLFLGVGFLSSALCSVVPPGVRWIVIILTIVVFVTAFVEGIGDTRERLRQLKEAQQDREEAFSEFMLALAQEEARDDAPAAAPAAEPPSTP